MLRPGGGGDRGFLPLKGRNLTYLQTDQNNVVMNNKYSKSEVSMRKKFAFTLAEVLITLGIIGVVAAMTMPTLIKNYQKKQTATQMRKTYAVLENALTMARAEHGELKEWEGPKGYIKDGDYEGIEAFAKKYVLPYIKYTKTCKGCEDYKITLLNGELLDDWLAGLGGKPPYQIFLPDGTILNLSTNQQARPDDPTVFWSVAIDFDINGKKKPNMMSKDVAHVEIRENKHFLLLPGWEYTYEEQTDPSSSDLACHKSATGFRCLNLLRLDDWEIKDHYPW